MLHARVEFDPRIRDGRISGNREVLPVEQPHQPKRAGTTEDLALCARILQALLDGTLPRIAGIRSWAGCGTGRPCHVCGQTIGRRYIEHEIDAGGPRWVHAACLRIWREESKGYE